MISVWIIRHEMCVSLEIHCLNRGSEKGINTIQLTLFTLYFTFKHCFLSYCISQ